MTGWSTLHVHRRGRQSRMEDIMRVYILDNGRCECDANLQVSMTVMGTSADKTPAVKWIEGPIMCVLIDHPDGRILWDLGCHPNSMEGRWPLAMAMAIPYHYNPNQLLSRQLELAGTRPEEINTVILSHMHPDHIGNIDLFTHADVYVNKKEFEVAQALVHASQDPMEHMPYVKADLEVPVKRYHLVDRDFEIVKGVNVIVLPGHTPGVLGMVVELETEGTIIFPGDAIGTSENFGPPVRPPATLYDSLGFYESVERVRLISKKTNGKIVFSHDIEQFKTLKLAPLYYG